ncbi:MAG: FAD-dependent oxidoreductase [Acidobacteriota bacterium]
MSTVVVVGAGCFGAWTAHHLVRSGCSVTLVDAYGAGHRRGSSGGETRLIRMGYGAEEHYTRWAWQSLEIWKRLFERTDPTLFRETGVLSMAREQDPLTAATLATLTRVGIPCERLSRVELESRWPQVDFTTVPWAVHEPGSGVLLARRAVATLVRDAEQQGVVYRADAVEPPAGRGRLAGVTTRSGETIGADGFVFACGPWLPRLFPTLLQDRLVPTRQEVLYFGPPGGDRRFAAPALPAWIDFGNEVYGVPDLDGQGFKIAIDRHGPIFDPDAGDRTTLATVPAIRDYLARRFPGLRDAPLIGSEVCQYENTSNGDFLIDRHPELENVWMVGGGSGHGFKHGPAVGAYAAGLVTGGGSSEPRFGLAARRRVQRRTVY